MAIVNVKSKYQIVIPAKLRKAAGIGIGDILKGRVERKGELIFSAQTVVNREKWSHLPKGIREGLEDLEAGRVYGPFQTADELMESLQSNMKRLRKKKR